MANAQPKSHIGPFLIERQLGRGAQGVVYLGHDKRLNRYVAIKTLQRSASDLNGKQLQEEGAQVARLKHPNIVPLFDVGEWQGKPYLVFEYIEGKTLSARLSKERTIAVFPALKLARDLLSGLAHAHEHGVLHCDIKPSNLLLDENDTLRISDFGISRCLSDLSLPHTELAGSIYYLAPELVDDKVASMQSDIYAVGAVLFEMLTGRRAIDKSESTAALYAIAHGEVPRPSSIVNSLGSQVDAIVMTAMARKPADRFANAEKMLQAIDDYLNSETETAAVPINAVGKSNTVSYLLAKIRRNQDFPAFSQHVMEINRLASSDSDTTVVELTNAVLRDYSLTNKLLRLVNSSMYGQFGGQITTVSRAVTILGFDNIRMLAVGLLIFDQIKNRPRIKELMEASVWCFTGAFLSRQISSKAGRKNTELTFIATLLHKLGEQLVIYYLPDEYESIVNLVEQQELAEDEAARKVLGVPMHVVGQQIGESWGLPPLLINAMQPASKRAVAVGNDSDTVMLNTVSFASLSIDVIRTEDDNQQASNLVALLRTYKSVTNLEAKSLLAIIDNCVKDAFEVVEFPDEWQTEMRSKFGIAAGGTDTEESSSTSSSASEAEQSSLQLQSAILLDGINDVTTMMMGDHGLSEILVTVLESIYRGLKLRRVLLLINNAGKKELGVRFGFAPDLEVLKKTFRLTSGGTDVISRSLTRQADLLVNSVETYSEQKELPELLPETGMFGVYPIMVGAKLIGAIYFDSSQSAAVSQEAVAHIQSLRNQAALAVKINS